MQTFFPTGLFNQSPSPLYARALPIFIFIQFVHAKTTVQICTNGKIANALNRGLLRFAAVLQKKSSYQNFYNLCTSKKHAQACTSSVDNLGLRKGEIAHEARMEAGPLFSFRYK